MARFPSTSSGLRLHKDFSLSSTLDTINGGLFDQIEEAHYTDLGRVTVAAGLDQLMTRHNLPRRHNDSYIQLYALLLGTHPGVAEQNARLTGRVLLAQDFDEDTLADRATTYAADYELTRDYEETILPGFARDIVLFSGNVWSQMQAARPGYEDEFWNRQQVLSRTQISLAGSIMGLLRWEHEPPAQPSAPGLGR